MRKQGRDKSSINIGGKLDRSKKIGLKITLKLMLKNISNLSALNICIMSSMNERVSKLAPSLAGV